MQYPKKAIERRTNINIHHERIVIQQRTIKFQAWHLKANRRSQVLSKSEKIDTGASQGKQQAIGCGFILSTIFGR